ncbi:Linear gramicidin synthetase subunit D [Pseudomonas coronafaciens pv. oryzae]|nr:Linear gramicidin synthetase subunit D [Pseudomonas coronafaciens pv. oryzae]
MQLAAATLSDRVEVGVQHVPRQVRDRFANRAGRVVCIGLGDWPVRHMHGGFGDAVHVDQLRRLIAKTGKPGFQAGDVQCLSAEDDFLQRHWLGRITGHTHQLLERRRRLVEHRDLLFNQQRMELFRRTGYFARHDDQSATVQQRAENLPDREVEGERMEQRPDVFFVELEPVICSRKQAHQVVMGEQGAFRFAGRARGVDHVGQVVRRGLVGRVFSAVTIQRIRQIQGLNVRRNRQLIQQMCLGQQQFDTAVLHQEAQAILRIIRVQRHVSAPGLEDRQHAHDHLQTALSRKPHANIRADALLTQFVGQLVGAAVELLIAQLLGTQAQGDGLRGAFCLGFDALMGAVLARVALHALRPDGWQGQFAETRRCGCTETLQQVIEMRRQLQNAFGTEVLPVVTETYRQHVVGLDHQGQRVMRLLLIAQVAEDKTVRRTLQGFGHRVVFEHQNVAEQRLATVPCQTLNSVKRCVFMFAQGDVFRLHLLHPVADGLF